MKNQIILGACLLYFSLFSNAQYCNNPDVFCMHTGTIYTCQGILSYTTDLFEMINDDTLTIYPATGGTNISISFNQTEINCYGGCDILSLYNGLDINSPLMGSFTDTQLAGLTFTASNPSGCLTLLYDDNSSDFVTLTTLDAEFSCTSPCLAGDVVATVTGYNNLEGGYAQYCWQQNVVLDASASIPPNGFSAVEYRWHTGEGNTVVTQDAIYNYVYEQPDLYVVTLEIEWSTGCVSSGLVPLTVAQNADIVISPFGPFDVCTGVEVELLGSASSPAINSLSPASSEDIHYLPDGAGFGSDNNIEIAGYSEGSVITDCSQLMSVGINIEHSYLGDLSIALICPNGTEVNLICWGDGGGGVHLGEPLDDDSSTPGIGYNYSWTPDATNGTFAENAAFASPALPPGNYESCEDMCALGGCPLNGTWNLLVTDNLAIDNGYIFGWNLQLDDTQFDGFETYQPTFGSDADSTTWIANGDFMISGDGDVITLVSDVPSTSQITYQAINSAGCSASQNYSFDFFDNTLQMSAGADFYFGIDATQVEGSVSLLDDPCFGSETFEICLGANEFYSQGFCSGSIFGCQSPIELTFTSGEFGSIPGSINIFDGTDFNDPQIGSLNSEVSGSSFNSSNANGCLYMEINMPWDGTSCQDGDFPPIVMLVQKSYSSEISYFWETDPTLSSSEFLISEIYPTELSTEYIFHADLIDTYGCALTDTVTVTTPQYIIEGTVFYDTDLDGIFDADETAIPHFPLVMNANQSLVFSDADGNYSAYSSPGSNTISIQTDPLQWTMTTPSTYSVELSELVPIIEQQNFGVIANTPVSACIVHTVYQNATCNLTSHQVVSVFNDGNVPLNGTLNYTLDPSTTYIGSDITPSTISGNTLVFDIENLGIHQNAYFTIYASMPGVSNIGEWLNFEASVSESSNPDEFLDTENFTYQLQCSYDPNLKSESTGYGIEGWKMQNESLVYTIQFQNTGTAPAQHVIITDMLPENLDWMTLQPIASSHDYQLNIHNSGMAEFTFENIMLPDSTSDEPGSHGYVTFVIEQDENLSPGTTIENFASIYFDLNEAIVTNQTLNTIVLCEDISTTLVYENGILHCTPDAGGITWYENDVLIENESGSSYAPGGEGEYYARIQISDDCVLQSPSEFIGFTSSIEAIGIQFYPNPASNHLTWKTTSPITQVKLLSSTGTLVWMTQNKKQPDQGIIDVSNLSAGVYMIQFILADNSSLTRKVCIAE